MTKEYKKMQTTEKEEKEDILSLSLSKKKTILHRRAFRILFFSEQIQPGNYANNGWMWISGFELDELYIIC